MQSSDNTEKYFAIHENFKLRCLRTIVETVKVAWKDKAERRRFILDDGTSGLLDFDGGLFNIGVYGVATSTSSDATDIMNSMKQLAQAYMQNGGSLSSVVDVFVTKDPSTLKRKLEQYDEEMKMRQDEEYKHQSELQQQQIESQQQAEASRMEHERLLAEMKINSDMQRELIKANSQDNSTELEKLRIQEEKIREEMKLKERQLRESERHNRVSEEISRIKKQTVSK